MTVATIRLYVDAAYAVLVMAVVSAVTGSVAAAFTGNTLRSLQVALAAFAATGMILTVRLWLVMRRRSAAEVVPASDDERH